jgi:hypothetical protein
MFAETQKGKKKKSGTTANAWNVIRWQTRTAYRRFIGGQSQIGRTAVTVGWIIVIYLSLSFSFSFVSGSSSISLSYLFLSLFHLTKNYKRPKYYCSGQPGRHLMAMMARR